jgi:hypothetical protein
MFDIAYCKGKQTWCQVSFTSWRRDAARRPSGSGASDGGEAGHPQASTPVTSSSRLSPTITQSPAASPSSANSVENMRGHELVQGEVGDDLLHPVAQRVGEQDHADAGGAQRLETRQHVVVEAEVLGAGPRDDDGLGRLLYSGGRGVRSPIDGLRGVLHRLRSPPAHGRRESKRAPQCRFFWPPCDCGGSVLHGKGQSASKVLRRPHNPCSTQHCDCVSRL